MCGISGSVNLSKAYYLYKENLKRGYFSSGFLAFAKGNYLSVKQKDVFSEDTLKYLVDKLYGEPLYCLFHSRAPTNSKAPYSEETTHPFYFGKYYVAHNGIITNFKSFPESAEFDVDSSIIPFHLTKNNDSIPKTYEQYEGLLTSWIYNLVDDSLHVVKAGSSLHVDEDSFSSVEFEGSKPVDEDGVVFTLYKDKLVELKGQRFKYDNPYEL
jgi:glutamine phosphoribosylpyrophosphate amidotransferase